MRYWTPKKIPGTPAVGIAVASYLNDDGRRHAALSCLVASFRAQTYGNWHLRVVHDGKADIGHLTFARLLEEEQERVTIHETSERLWRHGHPHRQEAMEYLIAKFGCEWLLCTNDDNYYAPVFLEWCLFAACNTPAPGCVFVYADMVHSHKQWKPFPTQPRYRHLDLGGFLVHASLVRKVKFDKYEFNGDGDWIDRLVAEAKHRVQKIPATLFVHN